jgi:hypothetical protein
MAIDIVRSNLPYAVAQPGPSGATAVLLMRHIIYECDKPSDILTDYGEEFRCREIEARNTI